jgi:hypothetical protein
VWNTIYFILIFIVVIILNNVFKPRSIGRRSPGTNDYGFNNILYIGVSSTSHLHRHNIHDNIQNHSSNDSGGFLGGSNDSGGGYDGGSIGGGES